ncbi:MFS transporter [Micromonospora sp. CPCC 206060]|uniref:MFS transporter n=1 Tax=Micromonospora sp. CPCC 206060 TaxID=3122406 RepID=UPI002FF32439
MTAVEQENSAGERTGARRWAIDLRPLRIPAYRRLWLGTGVGGCGSQIALVAVSVQMYELTRDSFWVGLLGIATFVPLLVFGLWGGAFADVLDRRRLMVASSVLAWVTSFGLLAQALLGVDSPVLLLVLVAVNSSAFAVSSPTRQAIIPRLVPTDLVPAANTLGFTTGMGTIVLGPLLAGLILAAWSPAVAFPVAYGVDVLLFGAAVWANLRLPALPPAASPDGVRRTAGLRSVIEGFRYLATTRVLLLSFAIDLVAMVFAMPRALFPAIAEDRFGGGAAAGMLYSAIAVGSMLAGLTSGWLGRVHRQGVGLVLAVVAWGVAIACSGLARQLWLVLLLLAVAGAADLVSAVLRQTMLMVHVPDEMRGRLQGVNVVVVAGGPRLGDLRAGAAAAAFGTGIAWVGGGVAAIVLAVLLAVAFPALCRYRPTGAGTVAR